MKAAKSARSCPREMLETAERVSRDQQYNIGHAAALLTTMAREAGSECIGRRGGDLAMQARWLRVEYLAQQLEAHVADLGRGLDKLEGATGLLSRQTEDRAPLTLVPGGAS